MAASKAELWDQLLKAIKIIDETYKYTSVNATNYLGMQETLVTAFKGDHVSQTPQILASMRSQLSAIITQGSSLLRPVILELAKIGYNSTATSVSTALDDIRQGMVDAGETVKERDFTFGAISAAGGNNGDGTVYRITKDKDGHDLENAFFEAGITKIEITSDFASGKTKGNEEALIFGSGEVKFDELNVGDTPSESLTVSAVTAADGLITNGDFETTSGATATTLFTGWTLGDVADFAEETVDMYRGARCLDFVDNGIMTQYIDGVTIDTSRPVFAIVRFEREASCDGTLTLRVGTQTEAVVLSAQSGWTDLAAGTGTSTEGWYDNFKEDFTGSQGIRITLELSGRTTGNLLIDEFIVAQPVLYDGKYYLLVAGENEYLQGDSFTFTDSVLNTGRTQAWIARLYGKYLPHTSGAPTYADA